MCLCHTGFWVVGGAALFRESCRRLWLDPARATHHNGIANEALWLIASCEGVCHCRLIENVELTCLVMGMQQGWTSAVWSSKHEARFLGRFVKTRWKVRVAKASIQVTKVANDLNVE